MAAAALLARAAAAGKTSQPGSFYWHWYDAAWAFCWAHLIDHAPIGGWYRVVGEDCAQLEDYKSPPGKVDYHTCGAIYEAVRALTQV